MKIRFERKSHADIREKKRTQCTEEYKELMHLRSILSHFAQYLQLLNIITAQTVRRYSGINEEINKTESDNGSEKKVIQPAELVLSNTRTNWIAKLPAFK